MNFGSQKLAYTHLQHVGSSIGAHPKTSLTLKTKHMYHDHDGYMTFKTKKLIVKNELDLY